MINIRESFWTISEEMWDEVWVWVRWDDFPIPPPTIDWKAEVEYVNVAELVADSTTAKFGFSSLEVCGTREWSGGAVVSPLLLDLDLDGDSQGNLDDLMHRLETEIKSQGWRYRVYQSGTGCHVELDPASGKGFGVSLRAMRENSGMGFVERWTANATVGKVGRPASTTPTARWPEWLDQRTAPERSRSESTSEIPVSSASPCTT